MTSVAKTGKKKRVLIVSFRFPPQGGMGALRVGKFAKYLPNYGWDPTILTVGKVEGLPSTTSLEVIESSVIRTRFLALDYTLPYQLATDEQNQNRGFLAGLGFRDIKRSLIHVPRLLFSLLRMQVLPFDMIGWYPYAVKEGLRVLNADSFDMIFSSSSPSTCHLIASRLHKKTNVPWVAEFRDLWTLNHYSRKHQPFRFIEAQVEKRVMRDSNYLVTVSEPLARKLETFHSKPVVVIPNGFDEADYTKSVQPCSKFTITYTGNIYRGKQDPAPLFEAIKSLREEENIYPSDFEIRFFGGNVIRETLPLINRYGLGDLIKIHGFVSLRESIRLQKESTALLLVGWNDPVHKGIYTGKVFEYLGAHRPILGIGMEDDVTCRLLQESGMGIMLSEPNEIKTLIHRWLEEFKARGEVNSYNQPNITFIENFTRKKQTEKLAKLFDEASQGQAL